MDLAELALDNRAKDQSRYRDSIGGAVWVEFGRISPCYDEHCHFCVKMVLKYTYIERCRRTMAGLSLGQAVIAAVDCEDKMCLVYQERSLRSYEKGGLKMAKVDFGEYLPRSLFGLCARSEGREIIA